MKLFAPNEHSDGQHDWKSCRSCGISMSPDTKAGYCSTCGNTVGYVINIGGSSAALKLLKNKGKLKLIFARDFTLFETRAQAMLVLTAVSDKPAPGAYYVRAVRRPMFTVEV